jgi:release factor glutamine methyltransferase
LTVHERVADARRRLNEAGLSPHEAGLSARLLAQHVLGWSAERFLADAGVAEPDAFAVSYDSLVSRRALREPLAYIVSGREFWGLPFEVTPDVLIPRPDTELIVEAALARCPRDSALKVADVGTGSGCLAVALAVERPAWTFLASDISESALRVARRNAERHHVADRITFERADLLAGVDGPFDLIVSNPPYVRERDDRGLQPEVRREPAIALFGGSDGFEAIGRLLAEAPARMTPDALLVFEFGCGQEEDIERLICGVDALAFVELRRDLQGIARTAVVRRR